MYRKENESILKIDKIKFNILLAKNQITIKDLANKSGLHVATLRRVARGKVFTPLTVGKIARALDVEVVDLLANEKD